jgi:pilus assembly protein CpaF
MSTREDTVGGTGEELRRRLGGSVAGAPKTRIKSKPGSTSSADTRRGRADYVAVKAGLLSRLLDEIGDRRLMTEDEEGVRMVVRDFVDRVLAEEDLPINDKERIQLADDLTDETLGVGPLAPLMVDPAVTDILVVGPHKVYVERYGKLEPTGVRFQDNDHVQRVIERIAAWIGRRIDVASPMLDARLPDGSRVNATIPPVSIDGPTISIRRFGRRRLRSEELLNMGEYSATMMEFLRLCVLHRQNILISGGTGAGKSTLLGAVAESIPGDERIVTIEDTAELILDQEHIVRLENRPPNTEGRGAISSRELVINSLRMRPDRIILGEVRGGEALDMLQAMNTGHDGSLCTVHANSPRDALSRLETMVLMSGVDLPSRAIREQIVSALNLVVHVRRFEDGVRRVEAISEVAGLEGATPLLNDIYRFKRHGREGRKVRGEFVATGVMPKVAEVLRERGAQLPAALFTSSGSGRHA